MKKSFVKKLGAMFVCAIMLCTSAITASAATSPKEGETELVEGIFIDPATFDSSKGIGDGIVLYANFTISATNLAPGRYVPSSSTYYIHQGVEDLGYTVSWSPTGNNIRLGFVNRQDSRKQYYITCKGGKETGTMGTANVPSGEYYVVFANVSSNSENVNGSATCYWK